MTLGYSGHDFLFRITQVNIYDLPYLLDNALGEFTDRLMILKDWVQSAKLRNDFALFTELVEPLEEPPPQFFADIFILELS